MIEVSAQNFLVAEVNNPVFPELNLFSTRTESISIQKTFKYKNLDLQPKLSYMNRWYVNEVYSLEEVITDNVRPDLKNSETYTPVYFDFLGSYKNKKFKYDIVMSALELTNKDKYDYYEVRARVQRGITQKLTFFIDTPLVYVGNYFLFDDILLGANYTFFKEASLSGVLSKMKSEIRLNTYWKKIFFQSKFIKVKKSYLEGKYINNFMMNFGVRY